jgi:hypothetical protein
MTRPADLDEHGTEHRYGCTRPGWTSDTPRRAGIHVIRCAGCGAVRLILANPPKAGGAA